jgi:hypothetical protein
MARTLAAGMRDLGALAQQRVENHLAIGDDMILIVIANDRRLCFRHPDIPRSSTRTREVHAQTTMIVPFAGMDCRNLFRRA